ncbi:MAG: murein biosynthesis integral membrane protein MurJ [Brevinematales bacterium]
MARLVSYRHTFVNSIGTFISRITGVLKQNVISYLFGFAADRFVAAFRIVNAFRRYIGEGGALGNSFIPTFQKKLTLEGEEKAFLFASNVINIFLVINVCLTILLTILIPFYFPILFVGFRYGSIAYIETLYLYLIMMPYIIFICLYAIFMGMLNSFKKFFASAFAPVVFNIFFIVFPILSVKKLGIYSLGFAVLFGVILMVLSQIYELKQIGFKYSFYLNFKDKDVKEFFNLFFPTAGNMLFLTFKNLLTTTFLAFFPGGNIVMLNALMIIEAPLGFISIAIGTVVMPLLSRFHSEENKENFNKAINEAIYLLSYFLIPITIFFVFFPDTVVNSIFRDVMMFFTGNTGRYSFELLKMTYLATAIYAIGLYAMGVTVIYEKIYYSIHDAKTPFKANVIVFLWSFVFYFSAFFPQIGMFGIFAADSISIWLTFFYYYFKLKKMNIYHSEHTGKIFILFLISLLAGIIVFPFYYYFYNLPSYPLVFMLKAVVQFCLFSFFYYIFTRIFKLDIKR